MPLGETTASGLENDLQRELRVEGFSGTNSWRVIACADGGAHLAEAAGIRVGIAKLRGAGAGQIQTVGEVEHLDAELGVHTLGDVRVFEDGEIGVGKSRAIEAVAAEVAP